MTAPGNTARSWYQELIRKTQETVRGHVPADATVLVASRGDDELLRLDSRAGWHFPRHSDGRYAGHHPADSAAAIQHLEELREKGAQYLIFPASSRWWLEYYEDFADHLNKRYSLLSDEEGVCTMYGLRPPSPGAIAVQPREIVAPQETVAPEEMETASPSPHLQGLVETLLPGASIAVVRGAASGLRLSGRQTVFPASDFQGDTSSALDGISELADHGVEFLVVPHTAPSWLDEHPTFVPQLERRYPLVVSQHHVCTIFELRPARPESVSEDERSDRPDLFGRLKSWWRGTGETEAPSHDANGAR